MWPRFIFRPSRGPADLTVGMSGVRLGERLLQVGVGDPAAFAAAAGKVGLTGQASAVVSRREDAAAVEAAAAREGVLVEVVVAPTGDWPIPGPAYDVALVDGNEWVALGAEALAARGSRLREAVRGGGRVLVVYNHPVGILGRLGFAARASDDLTTRIITSLERTGFGPIRFLADREGQLFVEAFRPRAE